MGEEIKNHRILEFEYTVMIEYRCDAMNERGTTMRCEPEELVLFVVAMAPLRIAVVAEASLPLVLAVAMEEVYRLFSQAL